MPTDSLVRGHAAEAIERAAKLLKAGGLVAFPTETVYGLGADAQNPAAVRRIFAMKGRPANHPLIVHVGSFEAFEALARDVPDTARALAESFWPGPLTLVVEKREAVPNEVTGGRSTVAVRMPSHPVALALLRAFGGPIAAPSANRFGRVSPTTADHVRDDLGADVDLVLDGGSAEVGVESTIVDVTRHPPRVLRLGGLGTEELELALPGPWLTELDARIAPGQLPSHYAPRAEVHLVEAHELHGAIEHLRARGLRAAALVPEGAGAWAALELVRVLPTDPAGYARHLYASLRELDAEAPEVILVVLPEERGIGRAVADRLRRAAAPRSGEIGARTDEIREPRAQNSR